MLASDADVGAPLLFYDLGSPYAYLAVERAETVLGVLEDVATAVGLPAGELAEAAASPEIKGRLREVTDAAWRLGVAGAPWILVGQRAFFGDDRLEEAAVAWRDRAGTVEP
jgi:2-hydroxychromene-2-carboxylate isomerase